MAAGDSTVRSTPDGVEWEMMGSGVAKTWVYIDGSAWNILANAKVRLRDALSPYKFVVAVTSEVAIEIDAIPDCKVELKGYIARSMMECSVEETGTFGFAESGPSAMPFDQGTFQSDEDRAHYASAGTQKSIRGKRVRKTGLSANEADVSLAVQATRAVVLTVDRKPGPLKTAREEGGQVVFLGDWDPNVVSLELFINESRYSR